MISRYPQNYSIRSHTVYHNCSLPTSFCPSTCNPFCQHHYSAFKSITLQRIPPQPHASQIITLESISRNTPILEASGTIYPTPTHSTTPITPHHHLSTSIYLKHLYLTVRRANRQKPVLIDLAHQGQG